MGAKQSSQDFEGREQQLALMLLGQFVIVSMAAAILFRLVIAWNSTIK